MLTNRCAKRVEMLLPCAKSGSCITCLTNSLASKIEVMESLAFQYKTKLTTPNRKTMDYVTKGSFWSSPLFSSQSDRNAQDNTCSGKNKKNKKNKKMK